MNQYKIFAGISIFLILISVISCKTDFEPHILASPVPVVYGVINPDDSLYKIRLTKSFIGPGNAYSYAANPDSIYYDDARVFLETRNYQGTVIDKVELMAAEIGPRVPGIFAQAPNIVYQTDFTSIRLRPDVLALAGIPYEIDLFVLIEIPGYQEIVESFSRLKPTPNIINPKGPLQKVYFYNEVPFHLEWTHSSPDAYFEVMVVMHYREILADGEREAEAAWNLTGIELNENNIPGGTKTIYTYYFRPERFYSQVRAAIPVDPEVKGRVIRDLDFIILTSDGSVKIYNEIEEIADDYRGASYTNINNGLGLFACYNTKGISGLSLGMRELDSLALGSYTKHLRFSRWE